ncbi:hypothetical protein ACPF04_04290 [Campylobacter sp. MOP51]|uniref:hypothetical protein n=1 Tax=Campylobacter canis TaxID=3378588 RepID=UPI003C585875
MIAECDVGASANSIRNLGFSFHREQLIYKGKLILQLHGIVLNENRDSLLEAGEI